MTNANYPFLCTLPGEPFVGVHLPDVSGLMDLLTRWPSDSKPPLKVNDEGMALTDVQADAAGVTAIVELTLRSYCRKLGLTIAA